MNLRVSVLLFTIFLCGQALYSQDTVTVSTFNYGSTTRDTVVAFPDGNESYRKILMLYNMRCKGARVSTGSNRNLGCGEWDYSCNTYITDSSRRDSFLSAVNEYSISDFSGTNYSYSNKPQYDYYTYQHKNVIVSSGSIISEDSFSLGAVSSPKTMFSMEAEKKVILYTAAELQGAGLTAGKIDGFLLETMGIGIVYNLQISLAHSPHDSFTKVSLPWTKVYNKNTLVVSGNTRFQFYEPFIWDGVSSIAMQMVTHGANTGLSANFHTVTGLQLMKSTNLQYGYFNGETHIETENYKGIVGSADRSMDVWIKPTEANGEICSWGTDRTGEKWVCRINGDSTIRIEVNGGSIVGTTNLIDNQWHHVAFSYSGTQVSDIKFYVDGNLEPIGSTSNLTINTTAGINVRISKGINNRPYNGDMDELRIWDKALTADEVGDLMFGSVSNAISANLVLHYDFSSYSPVKDLSLNLYDAQLIGDEFALFRIPQSMVSGYDKSNEKPSIRFVRGVYNVAIDSSKVFIDSLLKKHNVVKRFKVFPKPNAISDDSIATLSINNYWSTQNSINYYNDRLELVNTATVIQTGTIATGNQIPYYRRYPSSLEIMSFVTPYGINLDLGENGKTWVFDVTDFTPILKGQKRLFMSRGGQWQEEMDIKFLFIKGTPSREVKDIVQIWPTSIYSPNYTQILDNANYFPAVKFPVSENGYKIRSAITGHGQQGEFIPREHSIMVDNQRFTKRVWKECGANPVYPQGGTWIYDRAGWCPGMATDVAEYDITALVQGKDSITLDYTLNEGSGDSRYIINNQMVTYGPAKYNLDASVSDIVSPSNRVEYQRVNPMCVNPQIELENTGKTDITSITVEYWVNSQTNKKSDVWHGKLSPGEKVVHTLPVEQSIWSSANGSNDQFYAQVTRVNASADENEANNLAYSSFTLPDVLPNHILLYMRGNNAGGETSMTIKDDWGQIIYEKKAFGNNQLYRDTILLGNGCHNVSIKDTDGDGLSWPWNNDGIGFIRFIKIGGGFNKTIEPEFGTSSNFSFTVNHQLSLPKYNMPKEIICYPNPSRNVVYLDGDGLENSQITVYNNLGQIVSVPFQQSKDNASLDFSNLSKGFYSIAIELNGEVVSKKVLVE